MPTIDVDTTQIHYEDAGAGRPLLLVHGWGTSARVWGAQLPDLARDHRVVALDVRGCGRSGHPADGNTIARNARDLLALSEALGLDRPVVVGSSIGATFAIEAALADPDALAGVVCVDGPGHWAAEGMRELIDELLVALVRDRPAALEGWVPNWYGPAVGPGMAAWKILDSGTHIDALVAESGHYDPRPRLPDLAVPVTYVHGRLDAEIPVAVAEQSAALVPGGELVVLEDAGHMSQQEQPAAFNAVLRAALARFAEREGARHAVR